MASVRKRSWKTATGEARSAWTVDFVTAAGQRERRQFATKREADACRVEIEGQMKAGTYRPDAAKVTVAEVCEMFLEHCEGRMQRGERMKKHNLAVYAGHCKNYIAPSLATEADRQAGRYEVNFAGSIGAVKLAQLTPGAVNDFRDRLRDSGVTAITTRKIISTLHNALRFAISRNLTAINAAADVEVIRPDAEKPKEKIRPDEWQPTVRALIAAADEDFRAKLVFAAATGLRAGEFHALRWRHVDLDKEELTVETRVDCYGDEAEPKTDAGGRSVPLGESVVLELKKWKLRSKFKKDDDLVFPNSRGGYECHDNMVKRDFLPLFEKLAKLHEEDPGAHPEVKRLRWHDLRHFAISSWINAKLEPKTVQTYAGHSSLAVTMDRYGHLFKSADHKTTMDMIAKGLLG